MKRSRGFTLVELIMVLVIASILAATITVFFRVAVDSYFDTRRRAEMTDAADTAIRRISQDVRSAVPNSIRTPGDQCFELLPTSHGGRYRKAPDTAWDAANPGNPSAFVDTSTTTAAFDVLSPMTSTPADGDWVVIGNENNRSDNAYDGTTRAALQTQASPNASIGTLRINLSTPKQFPVGYDGGRFVVVPNNGGQAAVAYVCSGTGLDASGSGTGTLYRVTRAFDASYPTACPSTAGAAVLATQVSACSFQYDPNQGATQQSGFVSMRLVISRERESVPLSHGVHVDNAP